MKAHLTNILRPNLHVVPSIGWLLAGAWVISLLVTWALAVQGGSTIPGPGAVVATLFDQLASADTWWNLLTSYWLTLRAMAWITALGLAVTLLSVVPAFRVPAVLISRTRFLSLAGIQYLFVLGFGIGDGLKVALLTFSVLGFFVEDALGILSTVTRAELNHARTLGMGPWRAWLEVDVMARLHDYLEAVRRNYAMVWVLLTAVELLAWSGGGVGVLLQKYYHANNYAVLLALQTLLFGIAFVNDYLLRVLRRFLFPYADLTAAKD